MDDEGQKQTALLCRSMILFGSLCPGGESGHFLHIMHTERTERYCDAKA